MKTFCLVKALGIKADQWLSEFFDHNPRANESTLVCGDAALSKDLQGANYTLHLQIFVTF